MGGLVHRRGYSARGLHVCSSRVFHVLLCCGALLVFKHLWYYLFSVLLRRVSVGECLLTLLHMCCSMCV